MGDSCAYVQPGEHAIVSLKRHRLPARLDIEQPFLHITSSLPAQLHIEQPLLHASSRDEVFFGDTASLSILQRVRSLVAASLGPCQLVEEPLQGYLADFRSTAAIWGNAAETPLKPSQDEAEALLDWAMRATGRMLGVHRDTDIAREVLAWLSQEDSDEDLYNAMFWIMLAVGAQSCPEDKDEMAEAYFRRGHKILTTSNLDHANTTSVQAYMWATFYLLHACRRHAAIMVLTSAVRGAYAIGLHVFGYSSPPQEHNLFRERLWRTLRMLDLFISSSLGRQPSTYEIRSEESRDANAFINEMGDIHEIVMKEIHLKRGTSAQQFTYDMIVKHRSWTHRLHSCTDKDIVAPVQTLGANDGYHPNGPVLNLKQAYYWSIMLLTWPYLVHRVSEYNTQGEKSVGDLQSDGSPSSLSSFGCVAVSACIDSAVQTIDMLSGLLSVTERPKRLPYAINSIFVAALTLGTAVFANLDRDFPLEKSLRVAQNLLRTFQNHDPLAKRYLNTIGYLQAAGEAHVEVRCRLQMQTHRHMMTDILGDVDGGSQVTRAGSYIDSQTSEQWHRHVSVFSD